MVHIVLSGVCVPGGGGECHSDNLHVHVPANSNFRGMCCFKICVE